jgi:hypothetical protein
MDYQKEHTDITSENFSLTWWGSAIHLIHLTSYWPTFFYSIKEKHPEKEDTWMCRTSRTT